MIKTASLPDFLNQRVDHYNQPSFISDDPVSIPHLFSKKQDIEIAGFFAAIFAWGNRTTIIQKARELMELMNMSPHEFCLDPRPRQLKKLMEFKHRTFNTTDLLYFIEFLKFHYAKHESLETAFTLHGEKIEEMLNGFYQYFFFFTGCTCPDKKTYCNACKEFHLQAAEYVSPLDGAAG